MNKRIVTGVIAGLLVIGTGCSAKDDYNDDRGIGDAPSEQQPDKPRKIWANADKFPNVSAFCIGGNGTYTSTRLNAPPVIVVNDPECDEGGILND